MNALRQALRYPLQEEAAAGEEGGGGGDGKQKAAEGGDLGTIEDRARRMGWVPKEEFRGDAAKWSDAETFVKNGEESLPILRERMRKLEAVNADLTKSVGDFKKMSDTAYERAYAKAKKDIQADIKTAAKAGDEAGAEAAANELAALEREKAQRDTVAETDPVFDSWAAQNAWYTDAELRVEAEAVAFKLRRKGDKTEGVAFLDKVKEEMKKQFPEKFGNPRRQQPGGTERPSGGGEDGGSRGGKKGWEHMPADAKEAGERYIKQKLYKDKAAYAEAFWAQN